jgi:signal transduction histidine kinase/CheY-like chemotaxis protein
MTTASPWLRLALAIAPAAAYLVLAAAGLELRLAGSPIGHAWAAIGLTMLGAAAVWAVRAAERRAATALAESQRRLDEAQRGAAVAERMASIGTLAGGVAHEFNNLNAVVLGNVELALRRPDLPVDARRRLEQIREAVEREQGIVDSLLTFSRVDQRAPSENTDARHVVETTLALARRTLRQRRVELVVDLPPEPCHICVPVGALGQVLLNLLLNAADAVDRRHDPRIRVSVARTGTGVALQVEDNGVGIPASLLPRIFEPFVSTKGEHAGEYGQPWLRGTGLGLAVSRTLVEQMGGTIGVASEPERGSRFTVTIPGVAAPGSTAPATLPVGACARVLVADDESEVRGLLCEHLAAAGHVAIPAAGGRDAILAMERETPDVVLLNWSMPDLDGQAVLEHIELHPERRWPPVVVVSGWSGGGSGIERWRREIAGQLRKPFTYEQVRTAVDAALHGRSI